MNSRESMKLMKPVSVAMMTALLGTGLLGTIGARYNPSATVHSKSQAHAATTRPHLAFHGTITMLAQAYTPVAPGIKMAKGQVPLHELEKLAIQFHHMYPHINVKFVEAASGISGATNQWFLTQATAGLLPDVYWIQGGTLNTKVLPPSIAVNLAPYFNRPNPFIPGNKSWKSIMDPAVLRMMKSPTGAQYVLDGDWVTTFFYYNKNLFKRAGIAKAPTTYNQLLADCKILKANHIVPGADVPNYGWFQNLFQPNFLGKALDQRATAITTKKSQQYATSYLYHLGPGNPAKNPRLTAWWSDAKKLFNYWNPAQNDINSSAVSNSTVTGTDLFAAGKVAMIYQGSWALGSVRKLGAKFPIGSFAFPSLYGSSPYATKLNTSLYVGGPYAAFQYAIASKQADHTMTPAKFRAALAWLQFIGTPAHDQAVVNEYKAFVPTFKGTTPIKSFRGFARKDLTRALNFVSPYGLDAAIGQTLNSLFQEYVSGHVSFSAMKSQYITAVAQAIHTYDLSNHIHFK